MLSYARTMIQDVITQLQSTGAGILSVLTNQWFLLGLSSLVFSVVVRVLLGPVRGQEMSGFPLAPTLCGVMVITVGQTLFMEPAPGNTWSFAWTWRIDQLLLLFAAVGWCFGVLLDIMRRPFVMALFFGVLLGIAQCVALVVLLQEQSASLPETFSKVVAFAVISTFVVWRYAQAENGYSVLRISQLALAGLGLLVVGAIIDWTEIETSLTRIFTVVLLPSFAVAWLMWTGVGRGSNLGAVGLFGGLSPFLLFLGHQALVKESLSITAATLIVIIMVGPDMVSGFERRRNLSDRVPFVSGLLYLVLVFILYIALVFTAGLDARS